MLCRIAKAPAMLDNHSSGSRRLHLPPHVPRVWTVVASLALWLCAGGLLFAQSHGTAALVIWSPARVVLATDSKLLRMNRDGKQDAKQDSVSCKIRAAGQMFFAASGYYGRPGTDFDVWTSVPDAVRDAGSVREAAEVSEKQLKPLLLNRFKALQEEHRFASSEEA